VYIIYKENDYSRVEVEQTESRGHFRNQKAKTNGEKRESESKISGKMLRTRRWPVAALASWVGAFIHLPVPLWDEGGGGS